MQAELLPEPFVIAVAALLGAILGSFLNVCIARWGAEPKESVVRPPSKCPRCGAGIAWYDNVPVLSWLLLRGRCRRCANPISLQYPLVELVTAGIWAYMAWRYGATLEAARGAVFFTILLGITMTDARRYIIPDEFTVGGAVIALLFATAAGIPALGTALLGGAAGFAVLYLVGFVGTWVFNEDAMGGGDIKMMAMVGAFLDWRGVLLTIFLGALVGTLIFLPLTLAGRKKLVPFGIFLALGAAATWLAGPALLDWYGGYVRGA